MPAKSTFIIPAKLARNTETEARIINTDRQNSMVTFYDASDEMWRMYMKVNANHDFRMRSYATGGDFLRITQAGNIFLTGDLSITGDLTYTGDLYTSLTQNSVPFIGPAGLLDEDNASFTYNDGTNTLTLGGYLIVNTDARIDGDLGVGTVPGYKFHIDAGTDTIHMLTTGTGAESKWVLDNSHATNGDAYIQITDLDGDSWYIGENYGLAKDFIISPTSIDTATFRIARTTGNLSFVNDMFSTSTYFLWDESERVFHVTTPTGKHPMVRVSTLAGSTAFNPIFRLQLRESTAKYTDFYIDDSDGDLTKMLVQNGVGAANLLELQFFNGIKILSPSNCRFDLSRPTNAFTAGFNFKINDVDGTQLFFGVPPGENNVMVDMNFNQGDQYFRWTIKDAAGSIFEMGNPDADGDCGCAWSLPIGTHKAVLMVEDNAGDVLRMAQSYAAGVFTNKTQTWDLANQLTYIGDGGVTNYSKFEPDGTYVAIGDATTWQDIQFDIDSGKVPAANAPTWETFTANTSAYAFDVDDYKDLKTNEIAHKWIENSDIHMHVHITIKTAQATGANRYVKVQVWIAYTDTGDGKPWAEVTLSEEKRIPTGSAALDGFYLDLGNVDLSGYHIGGQLKCRVKRIDATGGVEYADDVYFTQIGAHAEMNMMGSRTELIK